MTGWSAVAVVALCTVLCGCGATVSQIDSTSAPSPPARAGAGCALPFAASTLLRSDAAGSLQVVDGLADLVQVTGGDGSFAALTARGTVMTWSHEDSRPRAVPAADGAAGVLEDVMQVAADSRTFAARTAAGRVVVWGDLDAGQAGGAAQSVPARGDPPRPVSVSTTEGRPLEGVVDVAVDGRTLAAVLQDGSVRVWGDGRHGQLGAGADLEARSPVTTVLTRDGSALSDVVDVAAGGQHVVAATRDGRVVTWGSDSHGQLGMSSGGTGAPDDVPVPSRVTSVAASELNSYAVTEDGRVLAWGNDESGQTGSAGPGPTVDHPALVAGASGVVCVSAGEAFAAALTNSGNVLTWGAGGGGQLAAGPQSQRREAGPALGGDGEPLHDVLLVGTAERTLFVGVSDGT